MRHPQDHVLHYILSLLLLSSFCTAEFYSIWPFQHLNGRNSQLTSNQMITDELKKDLGNDPYKLYVSQSEALQKTWYWYADLTPELVKKYENYPGVQHIAIPNNEGEIFRAITKPLPPPNALASTNDPNAPDQLRILSLPDGKNLADSRGYRYPSSAGEGVNIYVVDSGLTPSSPEFKDRTVSWIFAGPFAPTDMTDADIGEEGALPNQEGHGTCMASAAMGNRDGVARKASLTVVRSDNFSSDLRRNSPAEIWIDGLSKIADDIAQKPEDFKAIVSMSIGVGRNGDQNYQACFAKAFKEVLLGLDEKDVVQTVAAGNDGIEIDYYPALLAKPLSDGDPQVPNLVVVGGFIINDGKYENDIRDPEIKIYGPADDRSDGGNIGKPGLECASRDGEGYHKGETGTSFATAAVSGLLATFMSEGMTGAEARQKLFDNGIVRTDGGPKTPWNGLDGTEEVIEFPSDSGLPS